MEITIKGTGEHKELIIVDPKSGCAWTNDLLGNHDALPEYDDETGRYIMDQDDFEWWSDLIDRYQAADDRYHELLQDLDNEAADELRQAAMDISCDLENYPEALQQVCDEAEGKED